MALTPDRREVGVPQLDGRGAEGMSRALARSGQMAAQQGEMVAGVIGQVSQIATQEIAAEAKERGAAEGASAALRDDDGKLVAPDLTRSFMETTSQGSRRNVLAARYVDELAMDSTKGLADLRQQNRQDPDAFLAAARSWRDGTLSGVAPQVRQGLGQNLDQEIRRHFGALTAQRDARDLGEASATRETRLTQLGTQLADATRLGDLGAMSEATTQLRASLDDARRTGLMSPEKLEAVERTALVVGPLRARIMAGTAQAGSEAAAAAPDVSRPGATPSPRSMARVHPSILPSVERYASEFALPPGLFTAVVGQEGVRNPDGTYRRSPVGASGWAQVMPATFAEMAARIGESRPYTDNEATGRVGAAYLARMLREFGGNVTQAVGAYNAGPGRMRQHVRDGTPLPAETVTYIARVLGDSAGSPAVARAVTSDTRTASASALLGGPGTAGWQDDWKVLTLPERNAIAAELRGQVSYDRSERSHAQAEERLGWNNQALGLRVELARLDALPSLTPDQMRRRAEAQGQVEELGSRLSSDIGIAAINQGAAAANRREGAQAQETVDADAIERASARIEAAELPNSMERNARLTQATEGLAPRQRAVILTREAEEREREAGTMRAQAQAGQQVLVGMDGGPQASSTPAQQAWVESNINAGGRRPLHDPQARSFQVAAAAGGVVLDRAAAQAQAALAGTDAAAIAGFANLFREMRANPRAAQMWDKAVPQPLRQAYEGMADALEMARPEDQASRAIELAALALPVATSDKEQLATLTLRFGKSEAERAETLTRLGDAAVGSGAGDMPPEMRRDLNAAIVRRAISAPDDATAARRAFADVREAWVPSQVGMPIAGARPVGMNEDTTPVFGPRWMKEAPERELGAPWRGDRNRTTEWLRERLPALVQAAGIPEAEARGLRLGENAFLVPSDRYSDPIPAANGMPAIPRQREWQIYTWGPGGMGPLNRRRDGSVDPSKPAGHTILSLPLGVERARHEHRWTATEQTRLARAREDRAAAETRPVDGL